MYIGGATLSGYIPIVTVHIVQEPPGSLTGLELPPALKDPSGLSKRDNTWDIFHKNVDIFSGITNNTEL